MSCTVSGMANWNEPNETDDLLMPSEAARMLYVTTKTLVRMAERGDIEVIKLPSGHRRYIRSQVEAIRQGRAA